METFVGDQVRIIVSTGITLTGATITRIKFRRPDGTNGYWTSTIVVGAPTYMEYTTGVDDLDQVGFWQLQAYVVLGGKRCNGKLVDVEVHDSINMTTAPPTTATPTSAPPTTAAPTTAGP